MTLELVYMNVLNQVEQKLFMLPKILTKSMVTDSDMLGHTKGTPYVQPLSVWYVIDKHLPGELIVIIPLRTLIF